MEVVVVNQDGSREEFERVNFLDYDKGVLLIERDSEDPTKLTDSFTRTPKSFHVLE